MEILDDLEFKGFDPKIAKRKNRIVAALIDHLIIYLFWLALVFVLDRPMFMDMFDGAQHSNPNEPNWPVLLTLFLIYVLYFILGDAYNWRTIGKRLMKIRLVRFDDFEKLGLEAETEDSPIHFGIAYPAASDISKHVFLKLLFFILGIIGLIIYLVQLAKPPHRRTWYDRSAGLIMIHAD